MNFDVSSCAKFQIFRDPTGGAYSALPDPLAGGEGARCPSPRIPPPLSALRASVFGPSGRSFVPFPVREKISPPQNKLGSSPLIIMAACIYLQSALLGDLSLLSSVRYRKSFFSPLIEFGKFWRDGIPYATRWSSILLYHQFPKFPRNWVLSNCNAIHQATPPHRADGRSATPTGLYIILIITPYTGYRTVNVGVFLANYTSDTRRVIKEIIIRRENLMSSPEFQPVCQRLKGC